MPCERQTTEGFAMSTIEITKADMDKLHKDGEVEVGGHTLTFKKASVARLSGQTGNSFSESTIMDPLRRATIRLASQQPAGSQFKKALLDVLAQDFDPDSISDLAPGGAHESDSDEPYMGEHFTQQESDELSDKQVDDQLGRPGDGPKKYAAAQDASLRKATIRLASQQPKGSKLRKALLDVLKD
jgi:hypothetical protein